jgi:hypothetical protein
VSGEVAQALGPFTLGARIRRANGTDGAFHYTVAALTGFDNGLTGITFEDTAVLAPEGTLGTGKNSFAFHGMVLPPLCRSSEELSFLKTTLFNSLVKFVNH